MVRYAYVTYFPTVHRRQSDYNIATVSYGFQPDIFMSGRFQMYLLFEAHPRNLSFILYTGICCC